MNCVLRLTEAAVEFLLWWWWGGWGLQSHFRVQPNNFVEVVLLCVVVGVVTTYSNFCFFNSFASKESRVKILYILISPMQTDNENGLYSIPR